MDKIDFTPLEKAIKSLDEIIVKVMMMRLEMP